MMTSGGRRLAGACLRGAGVQGSGPATRQRLGTGAARRHGGQRVGDQEHCTSNGCARMPTKGMRASGLQDPVALVSIGGWSPNQGVPQPAIILNPSFSRHRRGLCPGRPYWAAAMGLSNHTLSTLTGSRQVEPRGKSMGISIDSEPTAIDLFKELHCSKTKGFSEPVKKAIEDMHAREVLTSPSVEDGHQAKTSIEAVS
uniref:Uncharacterized protein n=1 Tax=Oryza rufipogon TaxID=4529 RepID=A0A0E0R982_ORYRU